MKRLRICSSLSVSLIKSAPIRIMRKALQEVLNIRDEKLNRIKAKAYHELKKAFEVKSLLLNVEALLKSQIFREENEVSLKDFLMHTLTEKRTSNMQVRGKEMVLPLHSAL